MAPEKPIPAKQILDEPPPFMGRWPRVYRFVLVYLAAVIFVFWLFTRYYAPNQP